MWQNIFFSQFSEFSAGRAEMLFRCCAPHETVWREWVKVVTCKRHWTHVSLMLYNG